MLPPPAYKAAFVALLGLTLGCGDPLAQESESEVGSAQAAVVGGWAATDAQIFATVEIRHAGAGSGFCSGVLISPRLVATAAHCAVVELEEGVVQPAAPGSLRVVAGHLSSLQATPSMTRDVTEVRVHEDYDHDFIMGRSRSGAGEGGMGSPNDIALLFISDPFDGPAVAPLLTPSRQHDLVRYGDVAYVAGYGVYDFEDSYAGELYISDAIIDSIGVEELLTSRADDLGDSCYGDSGGPLYVPTEQGDFVVGLVSRGRSDVGRDCGDGGVYTLLSAYIPWIARAAGDRFQPRAEPREQEVSFLADGADSVGIPKTGALHNYGSCSASPMTSGHASSVWLLIGFVGLSWLSRRLSRC
jgi:secreted trypsin-like serine protease